MSRKLWLSIGIVVLLLSLYPALYLYSLSTVDVNDFSITGVKFDTAGITFSGTLTLRNDGPLEVAIDSFAYTMIFEPTGQQVAEGNLQGVHLGAAGTGTTTFTTTMPYPDITALPMLLKSKTANLHIDGTATARFLGIPLSTSFTATFDTKRYLQQYLNEKLGVTLG